MRQSRQGALGRLSAVPAFFAYIVLLSSEASAICGRKSCVVKDSWSSPSTSGPSYTAPSYSAPSKRQQSSAPAAPRGPNDPGWYCRAQASNGAWGWGNYDSEAESRRRALLECSSHSGGRTCTIRSCRLQGPGGSVVQNSSPTRRAQPAVTSTADAVTPGQYYCRAVARSGASGWAVHADQSLAATRAVNNCYSYSKGRPCTLLYCNLGGPKAASGRKSATAAAAAPVSRLPAAKRDSGRTTCSQCETELKNSIRARLGGPNSHLLPKWVSQSISGFNGCEQRSVERKCFLGQIQVRTIVNGCRPSLEPKAYEDCISKTVPP